MQPDVPRGHGRPQHPLPHRHCRIGRLHRHRLPPQRPALCGGFSGLSRIGAVGSVGLRCITGQSRELILERGDVLVPSGGMGVLGGVRGRFDGLKDGNIGLRGSLSWCPSQQRSWRDGQLPQKTRKNKARGC